MSNSIIEGFEVLHNSSAIMIAYLIWPFIFLEFPRYLLLSLIAAFTHRQPWVEEKTSVKPKFTVMIAGHNEYETLQRSVRSLWEQSIVPDEIIIVSDGSTDKTRQLILDMLNNKQIHGAHHLDLRGGKSAALNLAAQFSRNEILIILDCDCSLHRFALENIVKPFSDPRVGAVCGNISPSNSRNSILATMQSLEYLISLSLGRFSMEAIDQLACVSGAFGAYRRKALSSVEGLDAGSGEDFDLTLRLRKKNWKIRFAENALCYTNVPETFNALIAQRNRWEGDCIRLRFGKHAHMSNPFSARCSYREIFHQFEFLFFNVIGALAMPFYFLWLWKYFGEAAPMLGMAAYILLNLNDIAIFSVAVFKIKSRNSLWMIPYIPLFSFYSATFLRFARINAYVRELVFNASAHDNFVPEKVRKLKK